MIIDNTYNFLDIAADDLELSQYKFLALLKLYSNQLRKNRLYPSLENLVEISRKILLLMDMHEQLKNDYDENFDYYGFDNIKFQKKHSIKDIDYHRMYNLFNFSQWALPKIIEHIEEGKVLYDFVDRNLRITKKKSALLHKNYGFFVIEDHSENLLHLYRFNSNEKYLTDIQFKNIRTSFINVWNLEQASKELTTNENLNILNSATYVIHSNIDFPFRETILPVAKQKLIKQITLLNN